MGTLVALNKPFDLSLQTLIKYKFLLYISLFCFVSFHFGCVFLPKGEFINAQQMFNSIDLSLFSFLVSLLEKKTTTTREQNQIKRK